MRSVVFTDIDETLIHSIRRHAVEAGDALAAVNKHGDPVSYQTPAQARFFRWLQAADRVIGVTGRSAGAYQRVQIGFDDFAVVHHGALILRRDGTRDPDYWSLIQPELTEVSELLNQEWERLQTLLEDPQHCLRGYRQTLEDYTIEICLKHRSADSLEIGPIGETIKDAWSRLGDRVRIHHNGNNLALLPAKVHKAGAVAWLSEQLTEELGPLVTIGIGDSDTDHEFMAACDYFMIPSGSQLDQTLGRPGSHDAG